MAENESITKDPQIRKGVIASVIASLAVIVLIQPVLRLVWSTILSIASRYLQGYVDSIYSSAALGHRNYVDVLLLMYMYACIAGMATGLGSVLTQRVSRPEHPPKKLGRRHVVLYWGLVVLFYVLAVATAVRPFADLQVNTSFQQRLKVLAPRITDLEMKELEAAWASMKGRADYDAITLKMESIAKQHGITLPERLLK